MWRPVSKKKARGDFTILRKIWQAHYINKDTIIKLFNAYVKPCTNV
jgi:hypothetical protein